MKKLKCILLIDDSDADNFLHELVIEQADCAEEVRICNTGKEALDYFLNLKKSGNPVPDLVFLDINMPVMNGWEFLEEYANLPGAFKEHVVITMLSASMNKDDREQAQRFPMVKNFIPKPLTPEQLNAVLNLYFPER